MGKDILLTADTKKELLRAIDVLDSLGNWDDAEFVRKFGKTKNTTRKDAMMKIRKILSG